MSASQEKKRRAAERAVGGDKKTIEKKKAVKHAKRTKATWTTVSILIAILLIAVIVLNSNLFYTHMSAVTIGDENYTAAELGFYYKTSYSNFLNQYGNYVGAMGLDTQKSLSSQKFGEDQTWAEFFREQAISTLTQMTVLWKEAETAGFKLSEEDRTALESELSALSNAATENGFSNVDQFLAINYGKGLDYDTLAKLMERGYIAQAYSKEKQDSFSYNDSELMDYYKKNADRFDNYTYLQCFINGSGKDEKDTDKEASMKKAKELADSILETDIESRDDFEAKVVKYTGEKATESTTAGSSLSSDYSDWMTDSSRIEGDTTVIKSSGGYYVLYFIGRDNNDYNLVNVRHILIKAEAGEDGKYTDEAKETAKTEAEKILAEYDEGQRTEDSFAALANLHTQDTGSNKNGGLYEGIYKGQMVKEFNDWCFNESRQPGDTGIVFNEDDNYCGYHVIYYVGEGENYKIAAAEKDKRSTDYTTWYDEVSKEYTVSKGFTAWFVR